MKNSIDRPYYLNNTPFYWLKLSFFFGVFIFLFLWVFEPFQMQTLDDRFIWVAAGFGLVSFIGIFVFNLSASLLFKEYYNEEKWTLGKELLQTFLNLMLIGFLNFLFYGYFVTRQFSFNSYLWFQFSTITVGILPSTFFIILKERIKRIRYESDAEDISVKLQQAEEENKKDSIDIVIISSQNVSEHFSADAHNILYVRSIDNYVKIFYVEETVRHVVIRTPLKNVESELKPFPSFIRCHRSYIANLDNVYKVSGNAQGYKLHIKNVDELVPVSRQCNEMIRQRFTSHPG